MKHIILLLLLMSPMMYGQSGSAVHLLGRLPDGPCYSFTVQGHLAYVGDGSAVDIVDIGNLSSPKRIGRALLPGIPSGIRLVGAYAYVADGVAGLVILDVSSPEDPKVIATTPTTGDARSVDVAYAYAYVAHISGFTVFDISNPHSPQAISTVSTPGYAGCLTLQNDSLYLGAYEQGVLVYDIRTPSAPTLVRQVFPNGSFGINSIRVSGSYLFATSSPISPLPISYGRFHVFNLALRDSIPEVGSVSLPGDWSSAGEDLCINGSVAFVSFYSDAVNGMSIISIDSLSRPSEIGQMILTEPHMTAVTDSTLFVGDGPGGLRLYNIRTPSAPLPVSKYATKPSTYSVAASGSSVYLGMSTGGIRAISLVSPQDPVDFGMSTTGQNALFIDASGSYAYTTSNYGTVDIADVSRKDSIVRVASLESIIGTSIKVGDGLLYVTDRDSGLFIASVSDPLHPYWLGRVYTGGRATGVALSGTHAYVAAGSVGVRVVDVLDPKAPKAISTLPTVGYCFGVAVSENRALVVDETAGLRIFDISDPQSPLLLSTTSLSAEARTIAVASHFAYLGTWAHTTFVIDYAADPVPRVIDSVYTADSPSALTTSGDQLLIADLRGGLYVFQNDLISGLGAHTSNPVGFHLMQNYPNPFNPETGIRYQTSGVSWVRLVVYDILGQEVAVLVDEVQSPGNHEVRFDGSNLSSGIYFYRLTAGSYVQTRRMILLK